MEKEIKIKDFLAGMKRRLWLMIVITGLMTVMVGLYNGYAAKNTKQFYQSSTSILLRVDRPEWLKVFAFIAKDQSVLDKVNQKLELNRPTDVLNKQIEVVMDSDSPIMKITATDSNPEVAAKIANATGTFFLQQVGNVFGYYDSKILADAKPGKPIAVKSGINIGLGFAIGAVLSIGVALLLESLDDTVKSARRVEKLVSLPVLGSVSIMNKKNTAGKRKKGNTQLKKGSKGGTVNA
jgi:capsular polysaccharide biosynthesis protein